MSEQITDTAPWKKLEQIREKLREMAASDAGTPPLFDRLDRQAAFLADRLLKVDAELAPVHLIQNIAPNLQQAMEQIDHLASNRNRQHARQALEALGKATQQALGMPLVESAEGMTESWADVLAKTKKDADTTVKAVNQKAEKVEARIANLEQQKDELSGQIQAAKERVDSVVSEYQKQFSETQSRNSERFQGALDDVKKRIDEALEKWNTDVQEVRDELSLEAEALIERLRDRDRETKALALAMGATGVSANFQGTANKNERAANWLRRGAIFSFAVMAIVIGIALWRVTEISLQVALLRFGAAVIFGVLATYLARESTRQRTEAIRSRRIELELAALEPFIETLDPEAKGTLRKELVKTYFGRAFDKERSDEGSIKLGGSALDFVKTIKGILK